MARNRPHLGKSGRIVIPARLRKAAGLRDGEEVVVTLDETGLRILTARQAVRRAQDLVRRHIRAGESLADELVRDRRREARSE